MAALGGGYSLDRCIHEKKVCVPADACTFIILDEFEDGGPIVDITRLGKTYKVDGTFEAKVELNIYVNNAADCVFFKQALLQRTLRLPS